MVPERSYRGPKPTIPDFIHQDPGEFARLKIALENLLRVDCTELFKYQILMDHLKLEEACLIADSYLNSPTPYSDTMAALYEKYGQPHLLALRKIANVMDSPDIRKGHTVVFERFALHIRALMGILQTLGPEGDAELKCGSHVARLLGKLPPELHAAFRRHMFHKPENIYTLLDFFQMLHYETWCQGNEEQFSNRKEKPGCKQVQRKEHSAQLRAATILLGSESSPKKDESALPAKPSTVEKGKKNKPKPFCPYCNGTEHFLSQCTVFKSSTLEHIVNWLKENKRCPKCGRAHQPEQCTFKKPCNICQEKHLQILHRVNMRDNSGRTVETTLYLGRPADCSRFFLKVIRVQLHHQGRTLNTYAVLDDGSERTVLLSTLATKLGLQGTPEDLPLRTVRKDIETIHGSKISFKISPASHPHRLYYIGGAFTFKHLGLGTIHTQWPPYRAGTNI